MTFRWTERTVGLAVMHYLLDRSAIVVPRCNWTGFESDLLCITMDRRIIDVEIKVDRQDLRADAKKEKWWKRSWNQIAGSGWVKESKPRGWPEKCWKHYYLMPEKVWKDEILEELPEVSGIILMVENKRYQGGVSFKVIRKAKPRRDAYRITEAECLNLGRLCSLRMWDSLAREKK